MSNTLATLNSTQLKRALALREKIEKLEGELAAIVGAPVSAAPVAGKKRNMSAAGRLAISRAAKARWAKARAAKKAGK
jgi:hypothetical protein